MSEFSKGQWVAMGNTVTLLKNGENVGQTICKAQAMLCHSVKIPKKEVAANARLIAAAPEMFFLLEELNHELVMDDMRGYGDSQKNAILKIKTILNKVRGEK